MFNRTLRILPVIAYAIEVEKHLCGSSFNGENNNNNSILVRWVRHNIKKECVDEPNSTKYIRFRVVW